MSWTSDRSLTQGGKHHQGTVGEIRWCAHHQEFHPWPDERDPGYWDGWITPGLPGFMQ